VSEEMTVPGETAPAPPPAPTPSKALVPVTRQPIEVAERGILLRSFDDLQRFAEMVLKSGAAPESINTIGMVSTAIQMGMERGLAPLAGLRAVYFVRGMPSWRGEAAVALVRQSPLCQSYKAYVEGEGDARRGVCITWRRGDPEPVRTEFSIDDAKRANLYGKKGPWQEYRDRQLKWRAIGFNLKDQFPDILGGLPIAEEAEDWPREALPAAAPERPSLAAPPATPDPLLAQLVAEPQPQVDPQECAHKSVPPSRLEALAPGKSLVCPECGEELKLEREPGEDVE